MVEVGELEWITQEEDRCVIAHQIPVALLGVELHREAPDVPLGVGGTAFAGDGGESDKAVGLFPHSGEDLGPGVLGDVVGNGECAVSAGTLGVHPAFGDHLPIEVGKFLQEPDILEKRRSAWSGGHGVLIVDDRRTGPSGKFFLMFFHKPLL